MADGEIGAAFEGLAGDAGTAGKDMAESLAKISEQTADIEEENVARIVTTDGQFGRDMDAAGGDPSAAPSPAEAERLRSLGQDPATGQFRQAEMETAQRVEAETGIRLRRSTNPNVDWEEDGGGGKTYDAVGNFDGKYFQQQWPNLQTRIVDHLAKADLVPVDVSKFTPAQIAQVEQFIEDLGPRVFLVGK